MKIIEIEKLDNGAHRNQTDSALITIPSGWAFVPDTLPTPNFPFGDVTVETINGVETVTEWNALPIPDQEPHTEPEKDTTEELLLEMAADHEERICLMELGI